MKVHLTGECEFHLTGDEGQDPTTLHWFCNGLKCSGSQTNHYRTWGYYCKPLEGVIAHHTHCTERIQ